MLNSIVEKRRIVSHPKIYIAFGNQCFVLSPLMMDHLHALVTDDNSITSLNTTLRHLMECCSDAIISASWVCNPFVISYHGNDKRGDGSYNFSILFASLQKVFVFVSVGRWGSPLSQVSGISDWILLCFEHQYVSVVHVMKFVIFARRVV